MKVLSTICVFAIVASQAVAQQSFLNRLPDCAVRPCRIGILFIMTDEPQTQCFLSSTPQSCAADDFSCLCVDTTFVTSFAACNAGNCSVVSMLQATNETYAACGIPIRDQTKNLIGPVASLGALALMMVVMRIADRAISAQAQLGWDDLLIGLSGVSVGLILVSATPP